jgi:hypothetical protein
MKQLLLPFPKENPKDTVHEIMHKFKEGSLLTKKGEVVKSRKQAIAMALAISARKQKLLSQELKAI